MPSRKIARRKILSDKIVVHLEQAMVSKFSFKDAINFSIKKNRYKIATT